MKKSRLLGGFAIIGAGMFSHARRVISFTFHG